MVLSRELWTIIAVNQQRERCRKKVSQRQRDHYRVDSEKQKKKRSSHKAVELIPGPEGSLWWERFVKEVGLEPGVKERGSYGW